jgi:uncharacterized protein with PIN domain/sulfur carrier protein ThiS
MSHATFRFHSELASFLLRERREIAFDHDCARAATLKQAIESLGVPHTEVGVVNVNGRPATLARAVRDGDAIEVFPHAPGASPFEEPLAFIADAHLGGLARMLRMLGFDTVYDNGLHDPEIVARSGPERRVVLTRDRELLKCRDVLRGAFVHALKPEAQVREMATRYGLTHHMKPFSLCLHCNLPLVPADAARVVVCVPERIRAHYSVFTQCVGCGRVYWEGSHWHRMREVLASALSVAPAQVS